jgi:hypothetical protein
VNILKQIFCDKDLKAETGSIERNLRVLSVPEEIQVTEARISFSAETQHNEKLAVAGPKTIRFNAFLL